MAKFLGIEPSTNPLKKYDAFFMTDKNRRKKVSFGQRGADDFTLTKSLEARERYRTRHAKDRINEPMTPGALSWYILWSEPTLARGIAHYKRKFF